MTPESKLIELVARKTASQSQFVDRVITVSTGFLAFSLTFRGSIVGQAPQHLWLLKCAWASLAVATVCGVFLHRATASAAQDGIRRLQKNDDAQSGTPHPFYETLYDALCWAFPLGIAALMLFGILNTR